MRALVNSPLWRKIIRQAKRNALKHYLLFPENIWKDYLFWRRASVVNDEFVFIMGMPRSGTTLLQRMLLSHSGFVGFNGEMHLFRPRDMFSWHQPRPFIDQDVYHRALRESGDICEFLARLHRYAFPRDEAGRDKTFVEKTPRHFMRLAFLLDHFPQSKLLFLIRDARDVYCSIRQTDFSQANATIPDFARQWNRAIAIKDSAKDARLCELRYESLVQGADELARVMRFLGKELEPAQLCPARIGDDHRAEQRNHRRLKQPVSAASVGRWRAELSPHEQKIFEREAGENLSRYGYL